MASSNMFVFAAESASTLSYLSYPVPTTWTELLTINPNSKPNCWILFQTWRHSHHPPSASFTKKQSRAVFAELKKVFATEWSSLADDEPVKMHFRRLADSARCEQKRLYPEGRTGPKQKRAVAAKRGKKKGRPANNQSRPEEAGSIGSESAGHGPENVLMLGIEDLGLPVWSDHYATQPSMEDGGQDDPPSQKLESGGLDTDIPETQLSFSSLSPLLEPENGGLDIDIPETQSSFSRLYPLPEPENGGLDTNIPETQSSFSLSPLPEAVENEGPDDMVPEIELDIIFDSLINKECIGEEF